MAAALAGLHANREEYCLCQHAVQDCLFEQFERGRRFRGAHREGGLLVDK